MVFDGWQEIVRVVVVGSCAYLALLVILRGFGKRTLAKLNAFDFVVTVALGSTLATVLLSKDVSLIAGVTAMALLAALQFVVAWTTSRWVTVERVVKAGPTLLYRNGFLHDEMKAARITEDEIRQVARGQGISSLENVTAVVLETDGSLSVLTKAQEA